MVWIIHRSKIVALYCAGFVLMTGNASRACDLCGCYNPQVEAIPDIQPVRSTSWVAGGYAAIAEQFTYFGALQIDGREVANPTGRYENSSITQLVAGYQINSRFELQLNLPLIAREFKRPEGFAIDRGAVSGVGDMSIENTALQIVPDYRLRGGVSFHF